jgi:hypothetical protein
MPAPTVSVRPATDTRELPSAARPAAALAAGLLVVNGSIGFSGADLSDHMHGVGLVSEVTAGLAFLAGAVALALAQPVAGWRAWLWWLAPAGMAIAGATMVGVPLVGSEPAGWLFLLAVVPTFVGQVAAGLLGTGRRWPWWVGAGVALQLPIMFLVPLNGFVMAAAWAALAFTLRGRA